MNGRISEGSASALRLISSMQTDEEVMDLKRMRAKAIAGGLLRRVDTQQLDPRDGVSVGACRTDMPDPTDEINSGVTVFEVVIWCIAGLLTVAAFGGAPHFFQWALK